MGERMAGRSDSGARRRWPLPAAVALGAVIAAACAPAPVVPPDPWAPDPVPGPHGTQPPADPYLADSPWPISHQSSYQQASSNLPGITRNDAAGQREVRSFRDVVAGDPASRIESVDTFEIPIAVMGGADVVVGMSLTYDGVYVVTESTVFRVQWTGSALSLDEGEGAWSVEYDSGPTVPAPGRRGRTSAGIRRRAPWSRSGPTPP